MSKNLLLPMILGALLVPHAYALERTENAASEAPAANAGQSNDRATLREIMLETWGGRYAGDEKALHQLRASVDAADLSNLEYAASMVDFDSAMSALSGARSVPVGVAPAYVEEDANLVYVPITPCRVLDTRLASANAGRIEADSSRSFWGWGVDFASEQGGATGDCGIGENPAAIAMNVTAVNPIGAGYLTVYPFTEEAPLAATLNYFSGDVVGTESILKVHQVPGEKEFNIYSFRSVHVVADAVGYFIRPPATAFECQDVVESNVLIPAGGRVFRSVSCPVGFIAVTGGAETPSNAGMRLEGMAPGGGSLGAWFTSLANDNATDRVSNFYARCCRIPGR